MVYVGIFVFVCCGQYVLPGVVVCLGAVVFNCDFCSYGASWWICPSYFGLSCFLPMISFYRIQVEGVLVLVVSYFRWGVGFTGAEGVDILSSFSHV